MQSKARVLSCRLAIVGLQLSAALLASATGCHVMPDPLVCTACVADSCPRG